MLMHGLHASIIINYDPSNIMELQIQTEGPEMQILLPPEINQNNHQSHHGVILLKKTVALILQRESLPSPGDTVGKTLLTVPNTADKST